ncbi:asparaginase [Virgibacillus ihumii]|uniref:asparaginase n=1 Tax=Virgibacillus ihumii TaxID=2686091 RepID=UPI00157D66BB|nr:asparaginase [Virgibacillus ihumii]
MTYPIIAEEYRGGILENAHQGIICAVNGDKDVLFEKGDVSQQVYYRSSMKPIQAIPVFTTDIMEKFQLTNEEAALFTASQRGERYQEETLERLMGKLNLSEDMLICNQSYPLNETPKESYIRNQKPRRRLLHNCAGKHLGFLAYAREKGYDLDGYGELEHPIQQKILQYITELSETPLDEIHSAIDGCGVPVHAVSLKNMAISYLKIGNPMLIENFEVRRSIEKVDKVMHEAPEIVASHQFICTELLTDSNIVAKGGAQGVYCLALKKEKIGIALKVLSGSELIWPVLVAELLKKLDYSNKATIDRLLKLRSHEIVNDNGKAVGQTKIIL